VRNASIILVLFVVCSTVATLLKKLFDSFENTKSNKSLQRRKEKRHFVCRVYIVPVHTSCCLRCRNNNLRIQQELRVGVGWGEKKRLGPEGKEIKSCCLRSV
jgi:hypothetical protein